jgi:large subunit ribosomal protein L10
LLALLEGPTAIAFIEADGDAVAVAKALSDTAKETKVLAVRGGIMQGKTIDSAAIEELSKLPPLDQLRGQVVSAILAPLNQLVGLINAPLRDFVGLIDARIEQLGGVAEEEPEAEAPAEPEAAAEPEPEAAAEPEAETEAEAEPEAQVEDEPATDSEATPEPAETTEETPEEE